MSRYGTALRLATVATVLMAVQSATGTLFEGVYRDEGCPDDRRPLPLAAP